MGVVSDSEDLNEVTRLLAAAGRGEEAALPRVAELVYEELRRIAHQAIRSGSPAQTINTTALVHEAYLRLACSDTDWESRGHFLGVAARAMRSILVDHARTRLSLKRGGGQRRIALDDVLGALREQNIDVLALDTALDRFAAIDERKARVIELRFFGGLDIEKTATVLGISHATVERDWQFARAWLRRELDNKLE